MSERAELLLPRRGAAVLRGRHDRGARSCRQRLQVLGTDAARVRARPARCSTTAAASAAPGSFDFKKNWGFEPHAAALRISVCYRARAVPQNNPLNPKYRLLIALWRQLPHPGRQRASARTSCRIWDDEAMPWRRCFFSPTGIPYPPNKGDKVRSYHLLRHLAQRYRVHLGTFVDDPLDWQHVEKVQTVLRRGARRGDRPAADAARMRSLAGTADRRGADAALLSQSRRCASGCRTVVQRERSSSASLVFSSADGAVRARCAGASRRWSISSTWIRRSGRIRATPALAGVDGLSARRRRAARFRTGRRARAEASAVRHACGSPTVRAGSRRSAQSQRRHLENGVDSRIFLTGA